MADRDLHEKAKAVKPDQELPERRYWVAILYHHNKPEEIGSQEDFLWIKANRKITIETIHNEYYKKSLIETVLRMGDDVPSKTTKLSELNFFSDNMVVLRAIEASSPEARPKARPEAAPAANRPVQPPSVQTVPDLTPATKHLSQPPVPLNQHYVSPYADRSPHPSARIPQATPDRPAIPTPSSLSPGEVRSTNLPFHGTNSVGSRSVRDPYNNTFRQLQTPHTHRRNHFPASPTFAEKSPALAHLQEPPVKHESDLPSVGDVPSRSGSVEHKDDQRTTGGSLPPEDTSNVDDIKSRNVHLQRLMTETSPELLETGVQRGVDLLGALKVPLSEHASDSPDASRWLEQIQGLQKQAGRARTVVGVVGNTGAGKSSVINAMLDEERLVPTNCMRACTAVVTELSWNDNGEEREKYRAEIEFIRPEDWEEELRTLFNDLLDSNGEISRECTNEDSDAGVAYAKIRAVYPHKTKDMLADSSIDALMKETAVRKVLGTTQLIAEARPESFYRRLQEFVDSKEKVTNAEKNKDKKKEKKQMEFWPLIKVVKIYTKSDALSTGAVIVDLPGVHDANAARAAVAQNYVKQCTVLWIVAPINRAVDDKAAKTLLGESFKRQLKYDGTYSSVTFVCSKTDDISITEAADSLGLEMDIHDWQEQIDQIDRDKKLLKSKVEDLEEAKEVYDSILEDSDELQDTWEALKDDVESGRVVYAPPNRPKKRKRSSINLTPRKKRLRFSQSDSDVELEPSQTSAPSGSDPESGTDEPRGDPLTEEQCEEKLEEIKAQKKAARGEKAETQEKIRAVKKEIAALNQKRLQLKSEMSAVCIAGRNQYSKGAIQQDFAAGIKELDQENAADEDEENFNPEEDLRDYKEVARSLPVFCVSSRAYQKLCGRLQKDTMLPGFKSVNETEIPQLQAHCKKLTEAGRASGCRTFLNSLSQLLNSLSLWAANDGMDTKMTDSQKKAEGAFLQTKLEDLESGLKKTVSDCLKEMKENLAENIYDKFAQAIAHAEAEAGPTSQRWGAHRDEGGLYWATYKAICRRDGAYTNARGPHDFNAQLTEPLFKDLASGWEKAFQRRIPQVLQSYTRNSGARLRSFHQAVEARARANGTGVAGLHMLAQQLTTYEQTFADFGGQMVDQVMSLQKDANREFTPQILEIMRPAYYICAAESGTGSYARMKRHMISHVDGQRHMMFARATEHVRGLLTQMCRAVEDHMGNSADRIFMRMRADYLQVMGNAQMPAGYLLSKAERTLKEVVVKIIEDAEDTFREVIKPEAPDTTGDADRADNADSMDGVERSQHQQDGEPTDGTGWNEHDSTLEDADQHITKPADEDEFTTPQPSPRQEGREVDLSISNSRQMSVDETDTKSDNVPAHGIDATGTSRSGSMTPSNQYEFAGSGSVLDVVSDEEVPVPDEDEDDSDYRENPYKTRYGIEDEDDEY